jgi:uncharacterized protein
MDRRDLLKASLVAIPATVTASSAFADTGSSNNMPSTGGQDHPLLLQPNAQIKETAKANKMMIQNVFDAVLNGSRNAFRDATHDSLVMQVMGDSSWSITVCGKAKVFDIYFGYVNSRLSARNPLKILRLLADDDWVVMEATGDMVALDGRPYRNSYCLHYRIKRSQIVEMREYMDTVMCENHLGPFPVDLKEFLEK